MLEACAAVGRRPPGHEALNPSTLAVWHRRIALGMLLAWLVFFSTLNESVSLGAPWFDWYAVWTGGFLFAQPCLLAAWAALRPGPVILRLPQVITLAAFFGLANGWSTHCFSDGSEMSISEWFLVQMPQLLVLTATFTFLRHRRGWCIRLRGDQGDRNANVVQFSLRQLLVWTAVAAVILSLVRWISPEGQIVGDSFDFVGVAVLSAFALLSAIVLVPMMWLVLGEKCHFRFAVWTVAAVAISAATLGLVSLFVDCAGNVSEFLTGAAVTAVFIGSAHIGLLVVALSALIVLRLCGYRLVQTDIARTPDVPPEGAVVPQPNRAQAIQNSKESVLARPKAAVRFGCIAGLLTLGFVALLVPAHAVHSEKSRVAQDWELKQQWKALGVVAQVQEGRVSSIVFPPDGPISRALEKLQEDAEKVNVRSLTLSGQPIVDDELRWLCGLKDLRYLRLDRTRITDAGIAHLIRLTGLEELDLAHTHVTDEGLKLLARMPLLTTLGLDDTAVTDTGLAHLEPLRRLKVIYLSKTKVTQDGIAAFQSARPGGRVILQGAENLIRQMNGAGPAGALATQSAP